MKNKISDLENKSQHKGNSKTPYSIGPKCHNDQSKSIMFVSKWLWTKNNYDSFRKNDETIFYWQLRFCSGHKKLKIISYNEFHTFFELEINKNKQEMYPLDMDAHPCPSSPKTIFYNQHKIYFCPNPQMQFHMLTSIQLFIVWL